MDKRKKFIWNILTFIPVLLIATFIFHFSAQPASESAATSGDALYAILRWLNTDFDALTISAQAELVDSLQNIIRKAAHFLEYSALGFFLILHIKVRDFSRGWLCTLCIGVAYAISDEVHQMFVPGRSGQVSDVLLDSVGVLFGLVLFLVLWKMIIRIFRDEDKCKHTHIHFRR